MTPPAAAQARRSGLHVAIPLVGAAVLVFGAVWLVGVLITHRLDHTAFARADAHVDRVLAAHRTGPLNTITHIASDAAETGTVSVLAVLAMGALWFGTRRWRPPVFVAATVVGEALIFLGVTLLIDRHRPPVRHLDAAPPTSSFPSGHTAASITLYGGLAVVAWRVLRMAALRVVLTALAVVVPIAVAGSRLYRGMHFSTDVLGGALLGLSWLAATTALLLPSRRTWPLRRGSARYPCSTISTDSSR